MKLFVYDLYFQTKPGIYHLHFLPTGSIDAFRIAASTGKVASWPVTVINPKAKRFKGWL